MPQVGIEPAMDTKTLVSKPDAASEVRLNFFAAVPELRLDSAQYESVTDGDTSAKPWQPQQVLQSITACYILNDLTLHVDRPLYSTWEKNLASEKPTGEKSLSNLVVFELAKKGWRIYLRISINTYMYILNITSRHLMSEHFPNLLHPHPMNYLALNDPAIINNVYNISNT